MSILPTDPRPIGLLIRNSTDRQIGNARSVSQLALADKLKGEGHAVRLFDEQGTSGAHLALRKVTTEMLDLLDAGELKGIAAYDVKRLTRDEFGIDGATIAQRIVNAGGLFATAERYYDLTLDGDLLQFQVECMIAGIDWRSTRNTMWDGVFREAARRVMLQRPAIGYCTERVPTARVDKFDKFARKNPDHAHIIAALERAYDECATYGQVIARLTRDGVRRPPFRGNGPGNRKRPPGEAHVSTAWTKKTVQGILYRSIYYGEWSFGEGLGPKRSVVWRKFAGDGKGGFLTFKRDCPELAYWSRGRVMAWRKKFENPQALRTRERRHPHPLGGVLRCVNCQDFLIGCGEGTYRCRRAQGAGCPRPLRITDRVAAALLRTEADGVLLDAQDVAREIDRQQREHTPSDDERRLVFLQERAKEAARRNFERPSRAMEDQIEEAEREIDRLKDKVSLERERREADAALAADLRTFSEAPLESFDELDPDQQLRVYALAFREVTIAAAGRGAGRRWWIDTFVPRGRAGGPVRGKGATVRVPPPAQVATGAAPSLVVEWPAPGASSVVSPPISAARAPYDVSLLRHLAAALAPASPAPGGAAGRAPAPAW